MKTIRQAMPDDLERITGWTIQLHHHEDDHCFEQHDNFNKNIEKWLKTEMENSNSLFLIAEFNKQPVGFIFGSARINDNGLLKNSITGVVQILWIDAHCRSQGIAKLLLKAISDCFTEIGIDYLECTYTLKNQLGRQFWQSQGFKETSATARKKL